MVLTVEVETNRCVTFAKFIFRSHFIFASILNCDIIDFKWRKIWFFAIFVDQLLQ